MMFILVNETVFIFSSITPIKLVFGSITPVVLVFSPAFITPVTPVFTSRPMAIGFC